MKNEFIQKYREEIDIVSNKYEQLRNRLDKDISHYINIISKIENKIFKLKDRKHIYYKNEEEESRPWIDKIKRIEDYIDRFENVKNPKLCKKPIPDSDPVYQILYTLQKSQFLNCGWKQRAGEELEKMAFRKMLFERYRDILSGNAKLKGFLPDTLSNITIEEALNTHEREKKKYQKENYQNIPIIKRSFNKIVSEDKSEKRKAKRKNLLDIVGNAIFKV